MTDTDIFEQASKQALRFQTPRGCITTEDLWRMPLLGNDGFNLDTLALNLHKKVQFQESITSFVTQEKQVDSTDELRLAIAIHIIKVKMAKQKAQIDAHDKAEKKQKIMAIIAKKQDSELENAGLEDLQKMLKEL